MTAQVPDGGKDEQPDLESGKRRKATDAERADRLRRAGDRLVRDRVDELLQADPAVTRLEAEITKVNGGLHVIRLGLSKKAMSWALRWKALGDLHEAIEDAHSREKELLKNLARAQAELTAKEAVLAVRVRNELGLSDRV